MLEKLEKIHADLGAVIRQERRMKNVPEDGVFLSVSNIRHAAILSEIANQGSPVSPEKISELASKYGRNPSALSGCYSGKKPSLKRSPDGTKRELTDAGKGVVAEFQRKFGGDWLSTIPMDIIGNPKTSGSLQVILESKKDKLFRAIFGDNPERTAAFDQMVDESVNFLHENDASETEYTSFARGIIEAQIQAQTNISPVVSELLLILDCASLDFTETALLFAKGELHKEDVAKAKALLDNKYDEFLNEIY